MSGLWPGRIVRRATYLQEYHKLTHEDGVPFVPVAFWKDAVFSGAIIAAVAVCAFVFGPYGPSGQPDPTIIQTVPKPDFFFLWIYAALAYLPPWMETPFILIAPVIGIAILLALPFYASEGEKEAGTAVPSPCWCCVPSPFPGSSNSPRDLHPMESPHGCVERDPVASAISPHGHTARPPGRGHLQSKQCRNCHAVGGIGGQRGPALDSIATRMTEDQMIRPGYCKEAAICQPMAKSLARGSDGTCQLPRNAASPE